MTLTAAQTLRRSALITLYLLALSLLPWAAAQLTVRYDGGPTGGFEAFIVLQEAIAFELDGEAAGLYVVARRGDEVLLDTSVALEPVVSGRVAVGMITVPIFGMCEGGPTLFIQVQTTKVEGSGSRSLTGCLETSGGYLERTVASGPGTFVATAPLDRWIALQALLTPEAYTDTVLGEDAVTFFAFFGREDPARLGAPYPPLPDVRTFDELQALALFPAP
ncbi:hypothetical protein Trad_0056 [Truepera radiovictrix DSM 17093]|uniref:Uncharacterized protein n=1 Tax=Truepera radiovictrix (strain DSM 17093 / CIP 108686 / LMG 22925 / RQ-24) TaxID=649638 RepID=D7CX75_TRURR|nr:hypothetical protein [Truepera radiovictrix]ADI13199.1 hypothetical protein Trad_0056 [Truepera radiovictrix DSM 17093]WMT58232.1 hypothetical protein RCV51_04640 [Truepera radiovictrix]